MYHYIFNIYNMRVITGTNLFRKASFLAFTSVLCNSTILLFQNSIHSGLKSCFEASFPSACSSLYLLFQNFFHSSLYWGCFSGFFSCCFSTFDMSFSMAVASFLYSSVLSVFCLFLLSTTKSERGR